MLIHYLSAYEVEDLNADDLCIGQPYEDKVFVNSQSVHGGPLICLNDHGSFVLSGITSRNSKSIKNGYPQGCEKIFNKILFKEDCFCEDFF